MSETYVVIKKKAVKMNVLSRNLFNEVAFEKGYQALQLQLRLKFLLSIFLVVMLIASGFGLGIKTSIEFNFSGFLLMITPILGLFVVAFLAALIVNNDVLEWFSSISMKGYAKENTSQLKKFGIEVLNYHYNKDMIVDSVSILTNGTSPKVQCGEVGINVYYREDDADKCFFVLLGTDCDASSLMVDNYEVLTAVEA